MLTGSTCIVTGSTGRLGYETVCRLEQLGALVLPLVLPGYPLRPKRVEWKAKSEPLTIYTSKDLNALGTPDYVINFHWVVDRSLSCTGQLLFEIETNVHNLAYFWEWLAGRNIGRFINISTIKIFSRLNKYPISSRTEPRPISPYGIAKLSAEHFFDAFFSGSPWPVVNLRLCSIASPGEHPSQLLSRLYASAFENERITINKGHTSSILYIDEVVDLIISAAINAYLPRYIVSAQPISTEQFASTFERISAKKINADFIDLQPGSPDPIFESDIESLRSSWTRTISLEAMVKTYIHEKNKEKHYASCLNRTTPTSLVGGR